MIERQIVIGLITSTEFIQQIKPIWNIAYITSNVAKTLSLWCFEYYDKYNEAPKENIESIFYAKVKQGTLQKEIAEEIEEDILPDLSDTFEETSFNLPYAVDSCKKYFKEQALTQHKDQIEGALSEGDLTKAEGFALNYTISSIDNCRKDIDLSSEEGLKHVANAFKELSKPLFHFPKALGQFLNEYLVRDSLIGFMGKEKIGKTFFLILLAMTARKQGKKVAFFEAGDMSENQLLKRIGIYLTKNSDKKKYCGKMYEPVADCVYNQLNACDKKERECDYGIFETETEKYIRNEITQKEIIEAYKENPDYSPCHNCRAYKSGRMGAVWVKEVEVKDVLTVERAVDAYKEFFTKHKRSFKLACYPMSTLSVKEMKGMLHIWEKEDGFVPDVIICDYADLLVANNTSSQPRDQQNEIWKNLRNVSQEKHCCVITGTQADSKSYKQDRLGMGNFNEDKRKLGHVTAMFGLNQDKKGREKELGIMVLNEIAIREGDSSVKREVKVLQNLRRGRPFIGSFW